MGYDGRLPEEGACELGFEDREGVNKEEREAGWRRVLSQLPGRALGSGGQEGRSCFGGAERKVLERGSSDNAQPCELQ